MKSILTIDQLINKLRTIGEQKGYDLPVYDEKDLGLTIVQCRDYLNDTPSPVVTLIFTDQAESMH